MKILVMDSISADVSSDGTVELPVSEVMLSCVASAVDAAFALHDRTNGSTMSLIDGNMADRKLFSVAIYPERTIDFWESPTRQELFDFALTNLELLLRPAHALGTWFDDWNQIHVFDVVLLVSGRDEAVALALGNSQVAAFDLELRREIPVSRPSEMLLASRAGGVDA